MYLLSRIAAIIGKSEQSAADDAIVLFAAAAVRCRWNFGRGLKPLLLARHGGEGERTKKMFRRRELLLRIMS